MRITIVILAMEAVLVAAVAAAPDTRAVANAERLDRAADAEQARSSVRPVPARQAVWYALAGLVDGVSSRVATDADRATLGAPSGAVTPRVWDAAPGVQVWTGVEVIQDKAGSYALATAILYVRAGGRWERRGLGEIVVDLP